MKHTNVETTKLYEQTLRSKLLERLERVSSVSKKRIKNLISVMAVAAALFGPNGGIDSERTQSVLAQDTIEDIKDDLIETGQDVASWVKEKGLPAAKEGYQIAAENVAVAVKTATPVVEKAVKEVKTQVEQTVKPAVQGAVANLFDYSISAVNPDEKKPEEVVRSTQPSNKTVELRVSDLEELNLVKSINSDQKLKEIKPSQEFFPTVTPVEFGSEPEQSVRLIHKEEKVSLSRPFNFQETNEIFSKLNLTAEDFLNPDYQKIKNFDALTNPNVELLRIFPESVMQWAPVVVEECAKFNSLPENKGFEVSPNVALSILTVETFGNQYAQNRNSGASGGFQFMPMQFYNDYILTGAFDGGEGRIISYTEFAGDYKFRNGLGGGKPGLLHDKRYSTKLFIKYWSDMKRYNNEIYSQLGIDSPLQEFVFQSGEYNGGQLNAINTYLGKNSNYENTRYVRMLARIALIGELANDLRDGGYTEDYNKMLTSKLIENRILEAFEVKDTQNASSFVSTKKILQLAGQQEFMAGNVTRKLFLEEIPDVQPTTQPSDELVQYTYVPNPAIDIIYNFEYRS